MKSKTYKEINARKRINTRRGMKKKSKNENRKKTMRYTKRNKRSIKRKYKGGDLRKEDVDDLIKEKYPKKLIRELKGLLNNKDEFYSYVGKKDGSNKVGEKYFDASSFMSVDVDDDFGKELLERLVKIDGSKDYGRVAMQEGANNTDICTICDADTERCDYTLAEKIVKSYDKDSIKEMIKEKCHIVEKGITISMLTLRFIKTLTHLTKNINISITKDFYEKFLPDDQVEEYRRLLSKNENDDNVKAVGCVKIMFDQGSNIYQFAATMLNIFGITISTLIISDKSLSLDADGQVADADIQAADSAIQALINDFEIMPKKEAILGNAEDAAFDFDCSSAAISRISSYFEEYGIEDEIELLDNGLIINIIKRTLDVVINKINAMKWDKIGKKYLSNIGLLKECLDDSPGRDCHVDEEIRAILFLNLLDNNTKIFSKISPDKITTIKKTANEAFQKIKEKYLSEKYPEEDREKGGVTGEP
jgi:hypothetical protein